MKPKEKGDIAVAHAIHYFMVNNYEVCMPLGDKQLYDMIVERNGVMSRVQIKYAGYYSGDKKYKAALRSMGGNQSYHTAKKYADDAFELLFVYVGNGRKFLIPWELLKIRNSLAIESSKYSKFEVK